MACYTEGTMDGRRQHELADETLEVREEVSGMHPGYLSYLVRLWRVGRGREELWRASLQRPGTEEPIWFADVEEMLGFLRAETGARKSG